MILSGALRFAVFWSGLVCLCGPLPGAQVVYVSTEGRDSWTGTFAEPLPDGSDGPLGTLEAARERVRKALAETSRTRESVQVVVRGGRYAMERGLELGPEDSGIEPAPVTWQAYPGERVVLDGGTRVSEFRKLSQTDLPNRIPRRFHDRVWVVQLDPERIAYREPLRRRVHYALEEPGPLEVYAGGRRLTLARYPNAGWVRVADVPQLSGAAIHEGHHADRRVNGVPTGRHYGVITYSGDRPEQWASAEGAWVHGYWTWDWAESTQRIERIDTKLRRLELAPPHHRYGYTAEQRYYYFNIPEELDSPGEWYLDRESGHLFLWPPDEGFSGEVWVSRLAGAAIRIDKAEHLRLSGFTFTHTRGPAIHITDSRSVTVEACGFTCLGGRAVTIAGGSDCGVRDSDFTEIAAGAVLIDGGDRRTLEPGRHFAENNRIWRFSQVYRTNHPAIRIHGVGHRVAHNLVHDAPHMGMYFRGNDHLIEYNEIHDIAQETGDVGAIYTGRDYTSRGTIVRYNYLHHLHGPGLHGVRGVYLDDFTSGIVVFGNVFHKAGRAAFVGGGRDNLIRNNLFIECEPSVQVDGRGLSWAVHHFDESHSHYASTLRDFYAAANVSQPPYAVRYPELIGLYEDQPAFPANNVVEHNLSFGGAFMDLFDGLDPSTVTIRHNLVADPVALRMSPTSDQEPEFTVYRNGAPRTEERLAGNRVVRPDFAPYSIRGGRIELDYRHLPAEAAFLPLPIEKIGLRKREGGDPLP